MPDSELRQLADDGSLQNDAALRMQVKRMLSDARSWPFVENFAGQWLDLDGVDAVAVNPEFFPKFDNSFKEDMKQESMHFFAEVLRKDLSCLNFIDSDFVMACGQKTGTTCKPCGDHTLSSSSDLIVE